MAQPPGSRRAARDLIPATLAAGAAALIVAVFVGGTVTGLRHVLGPADASLPSVATGPADGAAASVIGDAGAGASVQVRPSLPPPIPVTAAFDLLFGAPPSLRSVGSSAPAFVLEGVGAADAGQVRGVSLAPAAVGPSRGIVAPGTSAAGTSAAGAASASAPTSPVPAATPAPMVAATVAPTPSRAKAGTKAARHASHETKSVVTTGRATDATDVADVADEPRSVAADRAAAAETHAVSSTGTRPHDDGGRTPSKPAGHEKAKGPTSR